MRNNKLIVFCFFKKVDFAVNLAHRAIFTNAAQNCTAGSRTFVHAKIYNDFIIRSIELTKKRIVGDPFNPNTKQGPQVVYFFCFRKISKLFYRLMIVNLKKF
jgi:acyl-CoA reductase-like NAD-dependent aldehyde dehydrogenase